mmetsp:Transcript_26175/g.57278  ORF Transcript_26175/g.57278 Transcript_26175/m.57278 type:complete len:200 (-) Transcript_26175:779-1378(-)
MRELVGSELAQCHDVLHGGLIGTTEHQHALQELAKGQRLPVLEEQLSILQGRIDFHPKAIQGDHGFRFLHQRFELFLRNQIVTILIRSFLVNHLEEHPLREVNVDLLVLTAGHGLNGFHQDTHQHVHDYQGANHNEHQDHGAHEGTLIGYLCEETCLVWNHSLQDQLQYCSGHFREQLTEWRVLTQLGESNTENIGDQQ